MSASQTLAQSAQDSIAQDILAGRIPPNSWLRLAALRQTYGVGLSPLREAMANLAGRGLIVQEGQRGFRVAPVSRADLQDLTQTRITLEDQALRAALRAGDSAWEAGIIAARHRLSRHPRVQERLIDEEWEILHRDFHFAFFTACPLPRLVGFCHQLHDQFDRYRRLAVQAAGRHPKIPPMYDSLLEATLDRAADTASGLLCQHITDSAAQVEEMAGERWFGAAGTDVADQPSKRPGNGRAKPRD
jgi:GntR family transcriptional regulator, carbon starvation induced regulator